MTNESTRTKRTPAARRSSANTVEKAQNCGVDGTAVGLVLDFQRTGRGFDPMWARIRPTVDDMLRQGLRKRSVKGHRGGDDENAVADTAQRVETQLWEVASKKPGAWFDPGRKADSVEALRCWLSGFCRLAVANYCRQWRGAGRKRKVLAESDLPLNDTIESSEYSSILKSAVSKIDPGIDLEYQELTEIVNECVSSLDDELGTLIRLNHWDDLSEREIAARIGMSVTTVHRRLEKAERLLEKALAARGIDSSWFGNCRP